MIVVESVTATATEIEIEIGGNRETLDPDAHLLEEVEHHLETFTTEREMVLHRMLIDHAVDPETVAHLQLVHQILTRRSECPPLDEAVASCADEEVEAEATGSQTEEDEDEHPTKIAATATPEVDLRRLDGVGIAMTVIAAIGTP